MTSYVVPLKQYNTQSRISPEMLDFGTRDVHHKRNRMTFMLFMATLSAQVLLCEKPNTVEPL